MWAKGLMVRQPGLRQLLDYWEKLAVLVLKQNMLQLRNVKKISLSSWRQCGQVVRMPDVKSGHPEFRSHSDHQLGLFQVVLG